MGYGLLKLFVGWLIGYWLLKLFVDCWLLVD